MVHAKPGVSNGVSYGCHPEYGDVVKALNRGLVAFKATAEYVRLCQAYPTINCDFAGTTYRNAKTDLHPEIADHPARRADIVIATEADFGEYNYLRMSHGLGGFDVELTKAACALANKTCAVLPAPWGSIWPARYSRFGWGSNTQVYPGEGYQSRWFHCAVGTWNLRPRQQSIAFSHPHTDKSDPDSGFVIAEAHAPAHDRASGMTVGVLAGTASAYFFVNAVGSLFRPAQVPPLHRDALGLGLPGLLDTVTVDRDSIPRLYCNAIPQLCTATLPQFCAESLYRDSIPQPLLYSIPASGVDSLKGIAVNSCGIVGGVELQHKVAV